MRQLLSIADIGLFFSTVASVLRCGVVVQDFLVTFFSDVMRRQEKP